MDYNALYGLPLGNPLGLSVAIRLTQFNCNFPLELKLVKRKSKNFILSVALLSHLVYCCFYIQPQSLFFIHNLFLYFASFDRSSCFCSLQYAAVHKINIATNGFILFIFLSCKYALDRGKDGENKGNLQ